MVGVVRGALYVWAATVGSVVGAGFASGEEVLAFFAVHGDSALPAVMLAGVLMAWFSARLLGLSQGEDGRRPPLFDRLFGSYARYAEVLFALFWLVSLAVMLAGAGVLCAPLIEPVCASAVLAAVLFGLSCRGSGALVRANVVITPLVLVMLCGASVYSLVYHRASLASLVPASVSLPSGDALMSCVLYVSYDLAMCVPALGCLPRLSRGARLFGAGAAGLTLSALLTVLVAVVSLHYEDALTARLPMLRVASMQADGCAALYAAVLMLAVVTSASSALVGLSRASKPYVRRPLVRDALLLLLALAIGQAGFSVLIESVVPALGALSLIFMLRLCLPVRGDTLRR